MLTIILTEITRLVKHRHNQKHNSHGYTSDKLLILLGVLLTSYMGYIGINAKQSVMSVIANNVR